MLVSLFVIYFGVIYFGVIYFGVIYFIVIVDAKYRSICDLYYNI